jgi:hypothetical protein
MGSSGGFIRGVEMLREDETAVAQLLLSTPVLRTLLQHLKCV